MAATIAIVAPGAMGSAIAARLRENGGRVLTMLAGRSAATRARAEVAGMIDATDDEIASVDIILSIVPPSQALDRARWFCGLGKGRAKRPLFVDCNAINPETMTRVVAECGSDAAVVDGCIIGLPPKPGGKSPTFYFSGDSAAHARPLGDLGLDVKIMSAPIGAASALKMSYAGITKGLTALGATMVLAASRAGALDELRAELAASQPALLARLGSALPDMLPKAYRWVAEMEEIAAFIGDDHPEHAIFHAIAELYQRLVDKEDEGAILRAFADDK